MTDLKMVATAQKKRERGLATAVYFLTTHSSDGDILDWWCLYPHFEGCISKVVGNPNRGWKFLPTSPLAPPFRRVTYHAIYERQHLILLWFVRGKARPPCVRLYAYDYESGEWVKPPYINKQSGPFLINPPVIVGDVIIWHHFGTIFGYDLITTQRTVLATVPGVSFGQPLYENMRSPEAFLLLVGRSKLCLMWHERDGEKRLYCYKYQIQMMTSSSDAEFSGLHFAGFQQLDVPGFGIRNVIAAPLWFLSLGISPRVLLSLHLPSLFLPFHLCIVLCRREDYTRKEGSLYKEKHGDSRQE